MGLKAPRVAGHLVACTALLVASPCTAQTTLRSMHLSADLSPDDGGAQVRVEYVLAVEGTPLLRFELLGFGSATTETFWLGPDPTATPLRLDPESGSLRAAEFRAGPADTGPELSLVGTYRIAEAVERNGAAIRVHVPVLTLAIPPEDGVPDLFTADIRLPDGWAVSEGFPSGLSAGADGRYAVNLAVTPSVVSLRARSDGAWRPGLPLVLDLIAAAVLLAFGLRGWQHLRRIAAAPMKPAARP